MLRLFVGIPLPEEARAAMALLQSGLPAARWVPPENLHLTLRFIGEVDEGVAEDVDINLAAVRAPAVSLRLGGVGHFGSGRTVRALWLGVERDDALSHLRDKVESAVVRAGLEPEGRRFSPHVTLARFRSSPGPRLGSYLEAHNTFTLPPLAIQSFTLFRSHATHDGSHYGVLADYPLLTT